MLCHYITGVIMLISTTSYVFYVFDYFSWGFFEPINPHTVIGVLILIFVYIIVVAGLLVYYMKGNAEWKTRVILVMKWTHKYFGYLLLLTAQVNIYYGSKEYAFYDLGGRYINGTVNLIVMLIMPLAVELVFQWYKRRNVIYITPMINISNEQFAIRVKQGEELLILEDLVLDISKYKYRHPGGRFSLE
mmetsp:Transcript_3678/g.3606  ORF Transcript_3678/g.3606 Transcript_3678/m.3606 type:complete len:189 (+) Transcript_3678:146-712(+)